MKSYARVEGRLDCWTAW